MIWWMRDPDRLKQEVADVDVLLEAQPWLKSAIPRLSKSLEFTFEFDIVVNGEPFPFQLVYPAFFPDTPPQVIPRDGRRVSGHQYGQGGDLCLEYRSDNWDPSVSGAMMIQSAYRLLSGEHPSAEEQAVVPSAHSTSVGQELRGSMSRFLVTTGVLNYVRQMPVGYLPGEIRDIFAPKKVWVAHLVSIGPSGSHEWRETEIPHEHEKAAPCILLRVPSVASIPEEPNRELLNRLIADAGAPAIPDAVVSIVTQFVVVADESSARLLFAFAKPGGPAEVVAYRTVDLSQDSARRLPADHAMLLPKKVGIVGSGSLGSKIAISLARSGVGDFLLVDDDIMSLGNLSRHELDARSLGVHKVDGVEDRIRAVTSNVAVKVSRIALGGQESSGSTASVLDQLGKCDLLIDATAHPQAFNFVASVARAAGITMVWAEVYAGGIGGFVARLRPDIEPSPHAARQQYIAWCHEQGVPWLGEDHGYETRDSERPPLIATDADVSVIAAHVTRIALDALTNPSSSAFPHPAYVIGLASGWLFKEPFDTRPIDFTPDGPWATSTPARTEEAISFVTTLLGMDANEDRASTGN